MQRKCSPCTVGWAGSPPGGHVPWPSRQVKEYFRLPAVWVINMSPMCRPSFNTGPTPTVMFQVPLMSHSGPGGAGGAGGTGGGAGGGGNGGGGGAPATHGQASFFLKPPPHDTLALPLHRKMPRQPPPAHIHFVSLAKQPNRPVQEVLDDCFCSVTAHPSRDLASSVFNAPQLMLELPR